MVRNAPPTPAQRCRAAKLRATVVEASTRLACEQRALATGDTAACTSAAAALRDGTFARWDASGRCAATGDSATLGGAVDALLDATLASLRPGGPAASRCTGIELGAAGRALTKLVKAHERDLRTPDAVRFAADLARAQQQLDAAFARALAKGDCRSSATAAELGLLLEQAVSGFRGLLSARCGNGAVDGAEACDGAGCSAGDPMEPDGCFLPGDSDECQCCAATSPCYVRGFGNVLPVQVPCCSGVCHIPGAEAGPNVAAYCTEPPPGGDCPCWTSASLDAGFPPGYFDQNGRGGVVCNSPGTTTSLGSVDTCILNGPLGQQYTFARGGAAVLANICVLVPDLDPANTGLCNGPPTVVSLTAEQGAACVAALQASQAFQSSCP